MDLYLPSVDPRVIVEGKKAGRRYSEFTALFSCYSRQSQCKWFLYPPLLPELSSPDPGLIFRDYNNKGHNCKVTSGPERRWQCSPSHRVTRILRQMAAKVIDTRGNDQTLLHSILKRLISSLRKMMRKFASSRRVCVFNIHKSWVSGTASGSL